MKLIQEFLSVRWQRRMALAAVVAAANCLAGSTAEAVILYRETFGTATSGGQWASQNYNWAAHISTDGSTATNMSANTTSAIGVNRNLNASKPGATDTIGQVNAGPVFGDIPAAYGIGIPFATNAAANTNTIFWTTEYPAITNTAGIDPSPAVHPDLKFSWFQGNGGTNSDWRLAIRQGGQWYVTQPAFANVEAVTSIANFGLGGDDGTGGANHGAELMSFNYTNLATAWNTLNFDGTFTLGTDPVGGIVGAGADGTMLNMGSPPAGNLTGIIDAFGMFSNNPGTGNRRFDTFTISDSTSSNNAGDHDGDGDVDAADYVFWRENLSLGIDAQTKYEAWRTNFGFGIPAGPGAALGGAVIPEPGSAILLVLGLAGLSWRRRRMQ